MHVRAVRAMNTLPPISKNQNSFTSEKKNSIENKHDRAPQAACRRLPTPRRCWILFLIISHARHKSRCFLSLWRHEYSIYYANILYQAARTTPIHIKSIRRVHSMEIHFSIRKESANKMIQVVSRILKIPKINHWLLREICSARQSSM